MLNARHGRWSFRKRFHRTSVAQNVLHPRHQQIDMWLSGRKLLPAEDRLGKGDPADSIAASGLHLVAR